MISETELRGIRHDLEKVLPDLAPREDLVFLAALVASQSPASFSTWSACDALAGSDPRLRDAVHPRMLALRATQFRLPTSLQARLAWVVGCLVEESSRAATVVVQPQFRDELYAAASIVARCGGKRDEPLIDAATIGLYYRAFDVVRHVPLVRGHGDIKCVTEADVQVAVLWLLGRIPYASRTLLHALALHEHERIESGDSRYIAIPRIAEAFGLTPEGLRYAAEALERADLVLVRTVREGASNVGVVRLSSRGAALAAKISFSNSHSAPRLATKSVEDDEFEELLQ